MQERPDFYYIQSAVIPYRYEHDRLEVLMITSRKKKRWVIPKGIIEPELSAAESAAKEALEEAGLEGQVSTIPIGAYNYDKWGGTCTVKVFAMSVQKMLTDWEESFRDREWVDLETAIARVEENRLKEILNELPSFIDSSLSQSDTK